jgi:hypothetical protein
LPVHWKFDIRKNHLTGPPRLLYILTASNNVSAVIENAIKSSYNRLSARLIAAKRRMAVAVDNLAREAHPSDTA